MFEYNPNIYVHWDTSFDEYSDWKHPHLYINYDNLLRR